MTSKSKTKKVFIEINSEPKTETTSINHLLRRFKSHDVYPSSKKANAKIVPFAIRGKYRLFRKGLVIEFGKPVKINQMEIEEANDYIRNEVLNILRKQENMKWIFIVNESAGKGKCKKILPKIEKTCKDRNIYI